MGSVHADDSSAHFYCMWLFQRIWAYGTLKVVPQSSKTTANYACQVAHIRGKDFFVTTIHLGRVDCSQQVREVHLLVLNI